ncbi:hemicentin-1-like [Penaeus japonicus]|uniref:hemicentin-1-like n=1 Tax=Penaeus japonicus TaxID=27405 RepID=UPI001C70F961|nr:hemicentin-1-like [Penaeus japonicus]
MLRAALFLTAILAVAGDAGDSAAEAEALDVVDPSSLVGQLTVLQLKELIAEAVSQAVLPLHNNCTDYSETGDCSLVVENDLCNEAEFYARYCCRSCTLAKQIPTYGPHLSLTAEVPISINVTTEATKYPRGSNVTITCEATGYPIPEVVWFRNYNEISSTGEYEEQVEDLGGVFLKTIRSDIIIHDYSVDYSHFQCMAINSGGLVKSAITINIDTELSVEFLPEVPIFEAKDDVILDCVAQGADVSEIIWFREVEQVGNSNQYKIIERRSFEDGLTKIHSKLTILRHKTSVSGNLFTCTAISRKGGNKEEWKRVFISDVDVHPNCHDLAGGISCYEESHRCEYRQEYVYRYCCRTCTIMGTLSSYGPHLRSDAEAPLEIFIQSSDVEIPFGGDATLKCRTSGFPGRQSISWLKNDTMAEESDNIQIEEVANCTPLLCEVESLLTIKGVKVSDTGKYICRTSNVIGMKDAAILLRLMGDGNIYIDEDVV